MEPKTNLSKCVTQDDSGSLWRESLSAQRDRVVLVPRSPKSALLYWEWTKARTEFFEKGAFSPEVAVTIMRADTKAPLASFTCRWDDLRLYFEPQRCGCYCCAALVISTAAGQTHTRLESNTIFLPRGGSRAEAAVSSAEMMRGRVLL